MQTMDLVVAGAHLSGLPLNHELTALDAVFARATRTAPVYRFYALATTPPKPGLVRVAAGEPGHAIEVEVWRLSPTSLGQFLARVVAPLCIGRVELEDASRPLGFLCEPYATVGAREISDLGGWRRALGAMG